MALEDFEKSLAEEQETREKKHDKSHRKHHHRHHHHSSRHRDRDDRDDEERRHRHKRSRREDSKDRDRDRNRDDSSSRRSKKRHHDEESDSKHSRDRAQPGDDSDSMQETTRPDAIKRDSWMEAPSALDIDYVQRSKQRGASPDKPKMLHAGFELKIHEKELNSHLRDLADGRSLDDLHTMDAKDEKEVEYTFGDMGSQWRMTRLKAVYREADKTGRSAEDIAVERFGDLRSFDNAREEELELDRRERYGSDYVGKDRPSGELYQERLLEMGKHRLRQPEMEDNDEIVGQGVRLDQPETPRTTAPMDQTALNRLRAQMMKAKIRGGKDAARLEEEYNQAAAAMANRTNPELVVLGAMDNRMLAGGARGETKAVDNKRGRERGTLVANDEMSIDDMVREERRTRGQAGGEGKRFAESIAKDAKFDNDLEYMEDNAEKLSKRVHKSEVNLKNTAVSDYHKTQRMLDNCQLCHHEDTDTPPVAPVISLGTRVYLTLPTDPELSEGSACIVPLQHRTNLLECDDDEWEEIRNFMKCLTRMYHDQGRDVIFYENAAAPHRKRHAAMEAVAVPYSLGETAPAFFKEAILTADEEWTQHKKLIDTLAKSKSGFGRMAFRRSIAKEMPYFHVWFEIDGGLGHIVEDPDRWPRGDLFAREVIGGMLDLSPEVIRKQGRWHRGPDGRVDGFKKRWRKFDWTRVLTEGS